MRLASHANDSEGFVGREEVLARLVPGDSSTAAALVWVHGPGGVGKTALLREASRRWAASGRPTRWLEGTALPDSLAILDAAAALGDLDGPTLVVLDDAGQLPCALRWAEATPPRLPAGSLLVLCDRAAPDPVWCLRPAVHPRLDAFELSNLDRNETGRYLDWLHLPVARHEAVFRMTYGHPLALGLVADVLRASPDPAWAPSTLADLPDVVETLLGHLVRSVPSERHRLVLRVGALVLAVTEDLLRDVVDESTAPELFEWLQGLSFVRRTPRGLALHDVVRETVVADLQWRDPRGAQALVMDLIRYFGDRLDSDPEQVHNSIMEVGNLGRRTAAQNVYLYQEQMHGGRITPATARDKPVIEAMTEELEGPESLALLRYWWDRAAAIHVLRSAEGEVDAFVVELRLNALSDDEADRDPPVRAIKRALPRLGIPPDDTGLLFRHWMARGTHHALSPAQTRLMGFFVLRGILAKATLSTAVFRDPQAMEGATRRSLMFLLPDTDFVLDGQPYGVFGNDLRGMTGGEFLVATFSRAVHPEPPRPLRGEFADQVRQALRDLRHPERLVQNPLAQTPLGGSGKDPAEALEAAVRDACEALQDGADPVPYKVLELAYLDPAAKQASAAAELAMGYSTYRRHLTAAVERVVDLLWRRAYTP